MEQEKTEFNLIGKDTIYNKKCASTNSLALQILRTRKNIKEGLVIYTDDQFAGRGQNNSTWISEPYKNLTFSIILFPNFIEAENIFILNIIVSLSLYDTLQKYFPHHLYVKWPNDLYYNEKKLGGILIENSIRSNFIRHSIIGIGLNVNQQKFQLNKTTSLYIELGKEIELSNIYKKIVLNLEYYYLKLKNNDLNINNLKNIYLSKLLGFKTDRLYKDRTKLFKAKIVDISKYGELVLEDETNNIRTFQNKEVEFEF